MSCVFMDGGSGINLMFASTIAAMRIPLSSLEQSDTTFHGIVLGKGIFPQGKIWLDVIFGQCGIPQKPLLENRVEFVHCIVIIMHCLPKLFSQSPFCFLKRPIFYSNAKPGSPEYFVLTKCVLQTVLSRQIKFILFLVGAVERARSTRTTTPRFLNRSN